MAGIERPTPPITEPPVGGRAWPRTSGQRGACAQHTSAPHIAQTASEREYRFLGRKNWGRADHCALGRAVGLIRMWRSWGLYISKEAPAAGGFKRAPFLISPTCASAILGEYATPEFISRPVNFRTSAAFFFLSFRADAISPFAVEPVV